MAGSRPRAAGLRQSKEKPCQAYTRRMAVRARPPHWLTILCAALSCSALSAALVPQSRRPDVVWVPSRDDVVLAILEMAHVTKSDVVYDLGCGDGRIVIEAAARYGARGVGIDI